MTGIIMRGGGAVPGRPTVAASGFQYTPRSADELRQRAQRRGDNDSIFASDVNLFVPKAGDNAIRIMPPPPGVGWGHYGIEFWAHYQIGVDEVAYLCLAKMQGKACPLCEARQVAIRNNEEDLGNALKPRARVAAYVIDRSQEGKGPLLWSLAPSVDADICNVSLDKRSGEVYAVDNPDEGFDVFFTREGIGKNTKYKGLQIDRKSRALSDDPATQQKWLQFIVEQSLDTKLVLYDYDRIKQAFEGGVPSSGVAASVAAPAAAPAVAAAAPVAVAAPVAARVPLRGATAPAVAAPVAVAVAPAQGVATPVAADLPSWDEIHRMTSDMIGEVGEEFKLQFKADGYQTMEELQDWVAEQLGVPRPNPVAVAAVAAAPAVAAPAGTPNWREKLR